MYTVNPERIRCRVRDCANHSDQGQFVGLLCSPCNSYLSEEAGGRFSQLARNTQDQIDRAVARERERCATVCENIIGPLDPYHPRYEHYKECAERIRELK